MNIQDVLQPPLKKIIVAQSKLCDGLGLFATTDIRKHDVLVLHTPLWKNNVIYSKDEYEALDDYEKMIFDMHSVSISNDGTLRNTLIQNKQTNAWHNLHIC